jgi:transposase
MLAADSVQYGRMASKEKTGYPSDVSDEEWAFVLPYLLLSREDSAHREHDLRSVFNGVRYIARTGNQWRFMPHDYPPWPAIYQQMQRWMRAGCFERLVEDTRILLREFAGRKGQPTAACIDSRTLQSTPESGARAGYDGAKRRKGSKVHIAVDTLGHLLALSVTPADQGYTGPTAAEAAQSHGIRLEVVKHPMAKRGFVLLPRRWVVERSFAWAARFRRLVRDYERLDTTLKGFHYVAFACLMLANMFKQLA